MTCKDCENREHCKTPCKAMNDVLWKDNNVYERHYDDAIVVFPPKKETHFSALEDYELNEISNEDAFPWASSGKYELSKTNIFVEKFFNRVPTSELVERFNIPESQILTEYKRCMEQIEKILKILDLRASGIKNIKPDKFTEDEKMFLPVHVFRFNAREVADMFHHHPNNTSLKLNKMASKYKKLFDESGNSQKAA